MTMGFKLRSIYITLHQYRDSQLEIEEQELLREGGVTTTIVGEHVIFTLWTSRQSSSAEASCALPRFIASVWRRFPNLDLR